MSAGLRATTLTSSPPLYFLVRDLLPEEITVAKPLLEMGDSPHHFTIKPSQALIISQSELFFWCGATAEPCLYPILKDSAIAHDLSVGLPPLPDRQHPWLSFTALVSMTDALAQTLQEHYPDQKIFIARRAHGLKEALKTTQERWQRRISQTTRTPKPYGIGHNPYANLLAELRLPQPISLPLSSHGPSLWGVAKTEELIQTQQIKVLIQDPSHPLPNIALFKTYGLTCLMLDPIGFALLEKPATGASDYAVLDWMETTLHSLYDALYNDAEPGFA